MPGLEPGSPVLNSALVSKFIADRILSASIPSISEARDRFRLQAGSGNVARRKRELVLNLSSETLLETDYPREREIRRLRRR